MTGTPTGGGAGDANDGLLGLSADLPDGRYRATVVDVFGALAADEDAESVEVEVDTAPVLGVPDAVECLLPATEFEGSTEAGAVYQLVVVDGDVVDVEFALQPTIRAAAADAGRDQYVVPLRWAGEQSGGVDNDDHAVALEPNHSLLVTGEPGAGKTEFVKLLLPQIESEPDEPVVVFDFKDDYTDWAAEHADRDVVRLSSRDSTRQWNIFAEADDEADFEQLGKALFRGREQTANSPFFPRAARQLFVAVLKYLRREGERSGLQPDNRELVDFFGRFTSKEVFELLGEHEDLRGALEAINPDASKQAAGVYATLQQAVSDLFAGDFAAADGEFSIREYVENPDGRVLVLDYPIEEGDRVTDVFRLFVDRAIQCALADRETGAYFVLDEFARIPHLQRLDTLVATGRARQTQAILGLQSLSQLAQTYDDATVDALLSGLTQEVFLRCGDERTVEYVCNRIGASDSVTRTVSADGAGDSDVETSVTSAPAKRRLQQLADGECVVYATNGWVHARVPMWRHLDRETQRALVESGGERRGQSHGGVAADD